MTPREVRVRPVTAGRFARVLLAGLLAAAVCCAIAPVQGEPIELRSVFGRDANVTDRFIFLELRLRGRKMERDVPLAYLKRLDRLYEGWINKYDMSEVLVIETDQLDYIHDFVHRLDVMQRIEAVLPEEFGKPEC